MPRTGTAPAGEGIGAWLRTLSADELTALLERRHDLLLRPPASLDDLGNRLSQHQSSATALQLVDRTAVQVVAVLAKLGGRATVPQLVEVLCRTAPVAHDVVASALDRLVAVGLAWPVGDAWRSVAGISHDADALLGRGAQLRALVLGLPLAQLRALMANLELGVARSTYDAVEVLADLFEDEKRLRRVLDDAPPEALGLLEHVAGAGLGSACDGSPAEHWLADRLLLLRQPPGVRALPREVTALVYGDRMMGVVRLEPQPEIGPPVPPAGAAQEALRLVEDVRALLRQCEADPPKPLQSGGVGVQAQRKLAKALDRQPDYVAWLLDLAGEAQLLGTMGSAGRLTGQAASWRALEEPAAYVFLVRAVLDGAAGTRPGLRDQPPPLAGWRFPHPDLLPLPLVLAGATRHGGSEPEEALLSWLDWRHYRPTAAGVRHGLLMVQLHALALLGLRADGGCPPWAAALRDGDDTGATDELAAALPPSQEEAIFQADGTVFVGGRASAGLRALVDAVADREGERTWRVTPSKVREVLDTGRPVDDLLVELGRRSARPLPQVVEQLVRDVATKHGRIQVVAASTLLRIDDVPLAVEVLRDKRLKTLALSQVQPGLLASPKSAKDVLAALRAAGHAPVGDQQAAPGARPKPVTVRAGATRSVRLASAADLAAQLMRAPAAAATLSLVPRLPDDGRLVDRTRHLTAPEQDLLEEAVFSGGRIQIDYVDSGGRVTTRVVSDLDVDGHLLVGWCELRDDERMFSPENVLAVRPPG